jgi:hypothetical protein
MDNYSNSARPNYPRVTQILDATMSEDKRKKLTKWEHTLNAKLGDGSAKDYRENAADMGTIFHKAIEDYFTQNIEPVFIEDEQNARWAKAFPRLKIMKSQFFSLEAEVWSDKHQYIGHSDCFAWEGDRLIVADWKTSAKFKRREWIDDHFIQGAAYAIAGYECGVIPVLPHEIQIYIFQPTRCQLFSEPFNAELAGKWLTRLKQYKAMSPITV